MIYRSRYAPPAIPDVSLAEYVLEESAKHAGRPALVEGLSGVALSYGELARSIAAAATDLRDMGVGRGGTVALMAPNQPQWAVAFYAITAAGAAVVPINPALTVNEVAKFVRLAGASTLVVDDAAMPKARSVVAEEPVRLVPLSSLGGYGRGPCPLESNVHPSDPAVIAFSSGTTGQPKGVVLTHNNLVATLCQHEGIYHIGVDDTVLAALPFFHIYGMSIILGYGLRSGATIVTLPRFDLPRYLELIASYRVTWLHVAPPILLQLLSPAAGDADLSSIRHVVSGAAPLDAGVARRTRDRLGCWIGQGYGMTEASPGITWVPDDGSVRCPDGSIGVLVAGTEARIVDPATGVDSPEAGELWIRGPQVMHGYLDHPMATAAAVVEDGWLRTGDIARVDADGVWWIVDRLKELIKYKGYQVAPAELEAILLGHPAIKDAAVIGVPDEIAGEIPKAYVVTTEPLLEADLLVWVAERVAPYKKIRAVEMVDAVPKSPSGKILRRQLKQQALRRATKT